MPSTESTSSTLPAVLCRLLVGHDTERLSKPTEDGRTHKWKAFVRAPAGFPDFNDRSFIKKVTFQLHDSFPKPKRNVRKPPFEVEETAYGCFDLPIFIQFDGVERTFTINHDLTLSIEKKAHVEYDNFIEISNPPSKEFINLALKYGGRLKAAPQDRSASVTPRLPDKAADEKPKKSAPLEDQRKDEPVEQSSNKHDKRSKHKEHKKREKSKERKRSKEKRHTDEKSEPNATDEQKPEASKPQKRPLDPEDEPSVKRLKIRIAIPKKEEPRDDKASTSKPEVLDKIPTEMPELLSPLKSERPKLDTEMPSLAKDVPEVMATNQLPIDDLLNRAEEMAKAPSQLISPPSRPAEPSSHQEEPREEEPIRAASPVVEQPMQETRGVVKDAAYWEKVRQIRGTLMRPIRRERYNLSFLHQLEGVPEGFVSRYERPIPVVGFERDFMRFDFKQADNRKLFERSSTSRNNEPQLLRLLPKFGKNRE